MPSCVSLVEIKKWKKSFNFSYFSLALAFNSLFLNAEIFSLALSEILHIILFDFVVSISQNVNLSVAACYFLQFVVDFLAFKNRIFNFDIRGSESCDCKSANLFKSKKCLTIFVSFHSFSFILAEQSIWNGKLYSCMCCHTKKIAIFCEIIKILAIIYDILRVISMSS